MANFEKAFKISFLLLLVLLITCLFEIINFSADATPDPVETRLEEPITTQTPTAVPELLRTGTTSASDTIHVGDDSPTAGMTESDSYLPEPPQGSATVIKTDGLKVYIDRGETEGMAVGMEMDVFRIDPIRDMAGNVLDEEEKKVARIRLEEVKPLLSIGKIIAATEPTIERGYFVRYQTPAKPGTGQPSPEGVCPRSMLYDPGGAFSFKPGSLYTDNRILRQQTAQSGPFCIDVDKKTTASTYDDARMACAKIGKRLCTKTELQKICALWEKPKPCPDDMKKKGLCPVQNTVMGFRNDQEWTSDPVSRESGPPGFEANSCSCPTSSPVCTHCYYQGCRGAKKVYRCCSEILSPPPVK